MLRTLLLGFGLVEIVVPRPVIEACERIGLRNPEAARRRPLALTGARLEGLVFVWLLARGREGSTLVSALLGLAGLVLVLIPRPIIRLSQHPGYATTEDLALRLWVVPAARLLGVLYLTVLLVSRSTEGERAGDTDTDADATAA